ncbi:hypothetical protein Tco_0918848, partial [Tanacetum coccineum]
DGGYGGEDGGYGGEDGGYGGEDGCYGGEDGCYGGEAHATTSQTYLINCNHFRTKHKIYFL